MLAISFPLLGPHLRRPLRFLPSMCSRGRLCCETGASRRQCSTGEANLFALGGALGGLQRVDGRTLAAEATTLSGWPLGLGDDQVAVSTTRYRAFYHQQVLFFIDAQNAQVAHRYRNVAHVAAHASAGKNPRRERRCTNRALDLEHVAVGAWTAGKLVALYHARKTASLAG